MQDSGSEGHVRAALWAGPWRLIAHRVEPFESGWVYEVEGQRGYATNGCARRKIN